MRRRIAVVALIGVLVLTACGSSDDDGAIPRGTTTSTVRRTTTTAAQATDDEQTITARYEAFWDARFKANQEPVDPDAPALREYATGEQLDHVIAETAQNRTLGLAFRRPEKSVYRRRVRVLSVRGDSAHLYDCVTNDGIVYRVATGEIIDSSVGTNSLDVTMRLVDGGWKLESAKLLQKWDGVGGCALDD